MSTDVIDRGVAQLFQAVMDMPIVGAALNGMIWSVATFSGERFTLLTSDRPVIMTDRLRRDDAHVLMPIGPRKLFLAVKNEGTRDEIVRIPPPQLMARVNDTICRQAKKFVYGASDQQLCFVENRLGRQRPA